MVAIYGTAKMPRSKKSSIGKFMVKHSREFCDKTSIHGLRYVSENGAHWFQSILWASFVISGGVFCCILMYLVWVRFDTNPTITAVETINYPIWNVPFPAMTICNVNKVQKSRTTKIKNMLLANNVQEDVAMKFFSSLANLVVFQKMSDGFTEIFKILNNNGYTTEKLMLELMQPCSELLKRCTWMGINIKCMDLFRTVKTDEGFCCPFNYYHSNETFESPDTNQKSKYKNKILHVAGAGIHTGMSVVLDVQEDEYLSATRIIPSALVHIHDALDYAEMRILAMLVEKGELVQMPIDPSVIDTTNDVKSLHHSKRNCMFSDEVSLTVGNYGYENCIIECRMNAIVDKCGCIPFYYNVKFYNYKPKIRFCELSDMECMGNNHRSFNTLYSSDVKTLGGGGENGLKCKCFPTCDVNWYSYTMDIGHMVNTMEEFNSSDVVVMHTYFAEFSCIKYKQSNLITWDGLFASFGGIFGLCLGGSILSIVEIVYHFTIKMYMSFRMQGNEVVDVKEAREKIGASSKWNKSRVNEGVDKFTIQKPENDYGYRVQKYPRKYGQLVLQPYDAENDVYYINKLNTRYANSKY